LAHLTRLLLLTASSAAACAAVHKASVEAPPPSKEVVVERPASGPAVAEYLRARLAQGVDDWARAAEALKLAVVHDPDSSQLRVSYAEALAHVGRLGPAEVEARRAVDLAKGGAAAADAYLTLGKILAISDRIPPALEALDKAVRFEGELARSRGPEGEARFDPEPWRALARVRLETGDAAGAAAACEQLGLLDASYGALALRELGGKLLVEKKADGAEKLFRLSVKLVPSDPEGLKLLAQVDEILGRFKEARDAWGRALLADPDDGEVLLAVGQLALRDGQVPSARAYFRQLLQTAPDEREARLHIAAAWLDAKLPGESLDVLSQEGDDGRVLYLRGMAFERLHRWNEAADALVRVQPGSGDLYGGARAALAYALSRAGRPGDGIRAVRSALQAHPRDLTLLYALGEAFDRAGQRDAAIRQMRQVLTLKADHAEALNYIGYSYAERGENLDEAEALLKRALEIEPDNGYYLDSLGWIYFKKGQLELAVKTLQQAVARAGKEATILEHLGDTYRAARRPADAAKSYRSALEASGPEADDPDVTPASRATVERKLRELGQRMPSSTSVKRAPTSDSVPGTL